MSTGSWRKKRRQEHRSTCQIAGNPAPIFATVLQFTALGTTDQATILQRLSYLLGSVFIALVQPAFASPQADADYIATRFVTADDSKTTLRDMGVKAYASKLAAVLATRSVKIRDQDKFVALLPDYFSDALFERLQKSAADRLVQTWEAAQLASVAGYLRNKPLTSTADRTNANADTGNKVRTIEAMQQDISSLQTDDTFKNELALTAVAVLLISLMVQENSKIDIDLKAPYVADMLEVDGVFSFPNRIVRNDLIRELRSPGP